MDNKGYAFTITILIISMTLISLLMFYTQTSTTRIKDTTAKITADKIHNFVEDIKEDLKRATGICVKRAAVYAINDAKERAIVDNLTLGDYVYHSCTGFNYPESGSQAAIAELMLCGTLEGVAVNAMTNNSLTDWKRKIEEKGEQLNLVTNVIITDIDLPLYDPWHIAAIVYVNISVSDEAHTSFHRSSDVPVLSMVSLVGLEDPTYQVYTGDPRVPNAFHPCNLSSLKEPIGSGNLGNDMSGGMIYYVANLSVAEQKTRVNDSNGTIVDSRGVNISIGVEDTVFVINLNASDVLDVKDRLNSSAGVINYEDVDMSILPVDLTVACVSDITGVLDLSDGDWVAIKNQGGTHDVIRVYINKLVDTGCYPWDS